MALLLPSLDGNCISQSPSHMWCWVPVAQERSSGGMWKAEAKQGPLVPDDHGAQTRCLLAVGTWRVPVGPGCSPFHVQLGGSLAAGLHGGSPGAAGPLGEAGAPVLFPFHHLLSTRTHLASGVFLCNGAGARGLSDPLPDPLRALFSLVYGPVSPQSVFLAALFPCPPGRFSIWLDAGSSPG